MHETVEVENPNIPDRRCWKKTTMASSRSPFYCQTIPKRQIVDSSNMKELAADNFKFDENGKKFSKWVENTVGKGEIARYEQFLFFPQCYQKTCTADTKKQVLVWKRIK